MFSDDPTFEVPSRVSWENPDLQPLHFLQEIRTALFENKFARRSVGIFLTHNSHYIGEMITLLSELERYIKSTQEAVEDTDGRRLHISQRLQTLTEGRFKSAKVQALLFLFLAWEEVERPGHRDSSQAITNRQHSVSLIDRALAALNRRAFPDLWVYAQAQKGAILWDLSALEQAGKAEERLLASMSCLRDATSLCTRERFPSEWNTLHIMRAAQLIEYAPSLSRHERIEPLRTAIGVCDEVIEHTSDDEDGYARISSYGLKALALNFLCEAVPSNYKSAVYIDLGRAADILIEAYRRAGKRLIEAHYQLIKAMAQSELYYLIGPESEQATATSQYAIDNYDAALEAITREGDPEQWALIQYFKGKLLSEVTWFDFSKHGGPSGPLREAIACFDASLLVITDEGDPWLFAEINDYKGSALGKLARVEEIYPIEDVLLTDEERIQLYQQAVSCFEAALAVYMRANELNAYAIVLGNKANALRDQALLLDSPIRSFKMLIEAIRCYDAALKELQFDKEQFDYVRTSNNKLAALHAMGLVRERVDSPPAIDIDHDSKAELIGVLDMEDRKEVQALDDPNQSFAFLEVGEALERLLTQVDPDHWAMLVVGNDQSNESAFLLRSLRRLVPTAYLVRWLPIIHPIPQSLRRLRGRSVILFVPWLDLSIREVDGLMLRQAIFVLRDVCEKLVLIATTNGDEKRSWFESGLGSYADAFVTVSVRSVVISDADRDRAIRSMETATRAAEGSWRLEEPEQQQLDMQQRVASLRAQEFPPSALSLLQAIWLLRLVKLWPSDESRIFAVARDLFAHGGDPKSLEWAKAWLIEHGWLLVDNQPSTGRVHLAPTHPAYVDRAVPEAFPVSPGRLGNCVGYLVEMLLTSPVDIGGLRTVRHAIENFENVPEQVRTTMQEIALRCLESEIGALDSSEIMSWILTYYSLGRAYSQRIAGDRGDNLHAAVRAYSAAAEVCEKQPGSVLWRTIYSALAVVYASLALDSDGEVRHQHVVDAISCFRKALEAITPETFPEEWLSRHETIARLVEATSSDDPNLRDIAIESLTSALTVLTKDSNDRQWATLKLMLARQYLLKGRHGPGTSFQAALNAAMDALAVLTFETTPQDWAAAHCLVVDMYMARLEQSLQSLGDVHGSPASASVICRQVIDECHEVLSRLTYELAPPEWISLRLLQCTAYLTLGELHGDPELLAQAMRAAESALLYVTERVDEEMWRALSRVHVCALIEHACYLDEPDEELQRGIKAGIHLLSQISHDQEPIKWGILHLVLGLGYASLTKGDEEENIENALEALGKASSVLTRDKSPQHWWRLRYITALCYKDRLRGDRLSNLEIALQLCNELQSNLDGDLAPELVIGLALLHDQIESDRRRLTQMTAGEE